MVNKTLLKRNLVFGLRTYISLSESALTAIVETAMVKAEHEENTLETFQNSLFETVIRFQYRKQDGSLRVAWGTLNPALIENAIGRVAAGKVRRKNPNCVTYFDWDRKDWRCFVISEFLGVCE